MSQLLQKLCLCLGLLTLPLLAGAQFVQLQTFVNQPVSHALLSNTQPFMSAGPVSGTVNWVESPLFNWTVTYSPTLDYVNANGVSFQLITTPLQGPGITFTTFQVSILPAVIEARHDIALTTMDQPVTIAVLDNDFSSTGTFELIGTPAANGGTAEIVGSEIVFTPAPGFMGLTDFNYVICAGSGNLCDHGTVSVNVLKTDAVAMADTVQVFTKREKTQFILVPENYLLVGPPVSGIFDPAAAVPTYTPEAGYSGTDFLTFSGPNDSEITYRVDVLDIADAKFTREDRAYTLANQPVALNVLLNDVYGTLAGCFQVGTPQYGTIAANPGGLNGGLVYTPPTGWTGVDRFTYTTAAPGCNGPTETQMVYIFVSNYEPAAAEYDLTTLKNTPVIVGYDIPAGSYDWIITDQGELGTLSYLAGPISQLINGTLVEGNDLLVYVPNQGVNAGLDVMEVTYCLFDANTGDCALTKTVKLNMTIQDIETDGPACVADCVWPGDTNNDGVVDVGDLLPIGRYLGEYGTPRAGADSPFWYGQSSADWNSTTAGPSPVDIKYADANGDRIVSHLDTLVVRENMGKTHALSAQIQNVSSFDVYLQGNIFAEAGDLVVLDIMLGGQAVIVEDLAGFRFPFNYDTQIFVAESFEATFDEESWFSYDSPIISLGSNDTQLGRLDLAMTRTSGVPASGFGQVGTMAVIVEDLAGFRPTFEGEVAEPVVTTIGGGDLATAMDGNGNTTALRVRPFDLTIRQTPIATEEAIGTEIDAYLDDKLITFPNPASDRLTVHLNGRREFSAYQLTDLMGRTLLRADGLRTNHVDLNLQRMPIGIYTLTVMTDEGRVNRKIEILR
ncbi:MAG: Ig-like domain-containing protein [Saprospiraceae bacterium]